MLVPTPNHGSPEPDGDWYKKVKRLLDARTSVNLETGCWEYFGTNIDGYGQITINKVFYYVHRLSAMMFHGYTPELAHLHVLHRCHNNCCWNPEHLYIGTNEQNIQDRMDAGRSRNQNTDTTHCKHGHEFTEENTYWCKSSNGNVRRQCRECKRVLDLERKARLKTLKFGKVG